jgi:hypothetical protein
MKRCQKCSRTYPDENQKFCTFDGGLLLHEQPPTETFDPNLTVRATSKELTPPTDPIPASEALTSMQLPKMDQTIADFGTGAFNRAGTTPPSGQTVADMPTPPEFGATVDLSQASVPPPANATVDLSQAPVPTPPANATVDLSSFPAPPAPSAELPAIPGVPTAPPPSPVVTAAPAKKRSALPWILAVVVVLLVVGGGGATAGYFFWLKPFLANRQPKAPVVLPSRTPDQNPDVNANASPTPNSNPSSTPTPGVEQFVPPAGSVKFSNSKDTLDGKLAEHYVDFSFYYPESWSRDPAAGVAGAASFVKVERRLPPDLTQENVAIGWYDSKGTFAADKDDFPRLVTILEGKQLKSFPNYRKLSEGPTKVNSLDAYEIRFEGLSKDTAHGDIKFWGRVIFLPRGVEGDKSGVTLFLFTTSLAPELTSGDDVGEKGELPLILKSFRFGVSP